MKVTLSNLEYKSSFIRWNMIDLKHIGSFFVYSYSIGRCIIMSFNYDTFGVAALLSA